MNETTNLDLEIIKSYFILAQLFGIAAGFLMVTANFMVVAQQTKTAAFIFLLSAVLMINSFTVWYIGKRKILNKPWKDVVSFKIIIITEALCLLIIYISSEII